MSWTEATVQILVAMWSQRKFSANEIAAELRKTRNAVIGKVHRLGLRQSGPPRPRSPSVRRPTKTVALKETAPPVVEPNGKLPAAISIWELSNETCRWPVHGTGHEIRFCGVQKADFND